MRNRAFRPIAAVVSILLLTGVPAQAGPVAISEVIQVLSTYQHPTEIRLRAVQQNSAQLPSGVRTSVQSSIPKSSNESSLELTYSSLTTIGSSDSILSGLAVKSDPQTPVEVFEQDDVEGTVCDCGEIVIPGGGFPKWPLLFLAAIPLFFIHDCDDCDKPTPTPTPPSTPTPTPTPAPIPEPASLFLFGTGLAAFGVGLRRRYAKAKLASQIQAQEGE